MTTKPSPAPWADEPFELIPLPSKRADLVDETHSSVYCADQMAQVHNFLIRCLNSIIQQAPYIPTVSDPAYDARDVQDLLTYVKIWVETVKHHHHAEETCIFPEIEQFAGKPGLMDSPKHQHDTFTPGLEELLGYASITNPEDFRWTGAGGMKEMIDKFSKALNDHLWAEIDIFLGLRDLDSATLRKSWDRGEKYSQSQNFFDMLYTTFPLALGAADKTYGGGTDFPPVPWFMPYLLKYYFAAGNGVWRFSPCDLWGQPKPLHFLPQSR